MSGDWSWVIVFCVGVVVIWIWVLSTVNADMEKEKVEDKPLPMPEEIKSPFEQYGYYQIKRLNEIGQSCGHCDAKITSDDNFCMNCGIYLEKVPDSEKSVGRF